MQQSRLMVLGSVLLAAAFSAPVWGADPAQTAISKVDSPRPGSVNYVEGQVSLDGQSLAQQAIGTTELSPGQSLQTQAGKAELLLTPGIFFRLGDNSSVTLISPSLTDTELRLDKGEAMIEAARLRPQTDIVVEVGDARVRLVSTGLYDINADQKVVRVFQGQVNVDANNREIAVKNQQQLAFDTSIKPEQFNQDQARTPDQSQAAAQSATENQGDAQDQNADQAPAPDQNPDDLNQWSSLRSSYLAEANVDEAQDYENGNASGDGWEWDSDYGAYTYIPPDGDMFYSPYGWGFYSPYDAWYAPFGWYGRYGHEHHHFDHDWHHWDNDGHQEAHYYDHFDHGAYRGAGSAFYDGRGAFIGRYPDGALAGGRRVQPGEGFHPGYGGEGYGGRGGEGFRGRGGEGFRGGNGGEVWGGHAGEGFHGAGSSGGAHMMGGGGAHMGGGGGHR